MSKPAPELDALRACLDERAALYKSLNGATDAERYLARPIDRADEETLTEPILAAILERVLGFPRDGYFQQFGKGGQKPDFTPNDLIAHSFVLDAKSSLDVTGVPSGKPARTDLRSLSFRRGGAETGRIEGEPAALDLLETSLGRRVVESPADVLLPKDIGAFHDRAEARAREVKGLLGDGRVLVEKVERLVCALYDLPAGLTDEVVAHADARAARG